MIVPSNSSTDPKTEPDIDTIAGLDEILRLPKEDSPDQQTLEAMLHSLPKESTFEGMPTAEFPTRMGYDSSWPNVSTNQALALESRPNPMNTGRSHEEYLNQRLHQQQEALVQASRVAIGPTGVASRRLSGFSDSANAWGWDYLTTDEIPGVASLQYQQQEEPAIGGGMGSFLQQTGTANFLPSNTQLPPNQELNFQRVLQEQRLKDLMDLNQKQQSNLKIQQEQLEQQRLELQLRDQEQLQQLRMELQGRGEQLQRQDQFQPPRHVEPLPQAPPLFQPHLQQERLLFSLWQQAQDQQQQQEERGPDHGGSQQQQRRHNGQL